MRSGKGTQVTTAVLLAAGTGTRLQPLTDDAPKCLTEVGGIPILERLVRCLSERGFVRLIVVVGYLGDCIREHLERHARGLSVEVIVNPLYETTNNIYSLWLARDHVREPFLLVESDIVFDSWLLREMVVPDRIAVARFHPWMRGTTVTLDGSDRLVAFHVGAGAPPPGGARPAADAHKTVNMYSFSMATWRKALARLDRRVSDNRTGDFYEVVFADMAADGDFALDAVRFDRGRWYEIDTLDDLREAERLFPAAGTLNYVEPRIPQPLSSGLDQ